MHAFTTKLFKCHNMQFQISLRTNPRLNSLIPIYSCNKQKHGNLVGLLLVNVAQQLLANGFTGISYSSSMVQLVVCFLQLRSDYLNALFYINSHPRKLRLGRLYKTIVTISASQQKSISEISNYMILLSYQNSLPAWTQPLTCHSFIRTSKHVSIFWPISMRQLVGLAFANQVSQLPDQVYS